MYSMYYLNTNEFTAIGHFFGDSSVIVHVYVVL